MKQADSERMHYLHALVAAMMQEHKSPQEIIHQLKEKENIDEHYARVLMDNYFRDLERNSKFKKALLSGIALTLLGCILTILSYTMASPVLGMFIVFYGLIGVGMLQVLRALIFYRK